MLNSPKVKLDHCSSDNMTQRERWRKASYL